eukprot:m.1346144 g.1346144  ORF g.1346144 m.1346144 type:complete len:244 (-) comp24904_c0_seq61:3648-4379(-)
MMISTRKSGLQMCQTLIYQVTIKGVPCVPVRSAMGRVRGRHARFVLPPRPQVPSQAKPASGSLRMHRGFSSEARTAVLPMWQGAKNVAFGVASFAAVDHMIRVALDALGLYSCPSSVAGIVVVGVASAHPAVGARLFRALGPAATWLKALLPLILVPPIAMPLTVALPHTGVVAVAAVACAFTMVINGHIVHLTSRLCRAPQEANAVVESRSKELLRNVDAGTYRSTATGTLLKDFFSRRASH